MADTKISALAEDTSPAGGDYLVTVDVSDISMASSGTDKKVKISSLVVAESQVTGLVADLAAKAPLASPTLTGTPVAPTASPGTDTTQLATTAFVAAAVSGLGTVTAVSVATANGFAGTVANATTTPAITISTSVTGILKGDGSGVSAAVADTDYATPGGVTSYVSAVVAGYQPLDGELTALAGLASAADRLPYFTGSGTASLATFTAAGRALVDDADAAAQRTTLGLVIGANIQAWDADLDGLAGLGTTGFVKRTGAGAFAAAALASGDIPDLSATYSPRAGSTSLVTLGTVTTGTWSATAIGPTKGGTGQTGYTLGDVLYSDASNSLARLAGNITTTRKFLRQTGGGASSAAPAWDTLVAGDVPDLSATYSPVAGSASIVTVGTIATGVWSGTTIAVNKGGTGQTTYTDGQLLIGNSAGNTLSKSTLTAGSGITITNGGGTITVAASGGGGSPGGSSGQVQYNNSAAFGGASLVAISANGNLVLGAQTTPGSLADGELHQGTQKTLTAQLNGMAHRFVGCLFSQTADVAVANTTTETSVVGSGVGSVALPANFLVAGKTIRVTACGYQQNAGAQLNTKLLLGGTTLAASGAISITTTTGANRYWEVTFLLTCRSAGVSGSVQAQGRRLFFISANNGQNIDAVTTAAVTVNTTGALTLDVTATWGTASASNVLTCTNLTVEVLN